VSHAAPAPFTSQVYKTTPVRQAYHQPVTTYHRPAATYQKPVTTYQKPVTTYHQPSATQYSRPVAAAPRPQYGEKCTLDYVEEYAQVCTPTLEKECTQELVPAGVKLSQEYDCYPVTRTVCAEDEDIEIVEVCAVSYTLEEVPAEAQLVDVKWEKKCVEEVVCVNPHSIGAYHASAYCKEQIKTVCVLGPVVYPAKAPVLMKLPQPYEVCITKDIVLPRVKCQQVSDKRCATVPRILPGDEVSIDRCTVSLGQEVCKDTNIKLPRQACLEKFTKTKLVYEYEEYKAETSRY